MLLPALFVLGSTHALRLINSQSIGVYASYELEAPGFQRLYTALLAIPAENPDLRLTIPADVRRKAYAASPAFAQLRDELEESEKLGGYRRICEAQTGVPGEYGAWTPWALRGAVWAHLRPHPKSARDIDELFLRAATELRQAQKQGRLPARAVPVSFVPPEWGLVIRSAPGSLVSVLKNLGRPMWIQPDETSDPWARAAFDAGVLRRTHLANAAGQAGGRREWLREKLVRAHPSLIRAAGASAILGVGLTLWGVRRGVVEPRWLVVLAILWTALLGRLAVLVLMDMTGITSQSRYLLPVNLLILVLGVLGVQTAVAMFGSRSRFPRVSAPQAAGDER